MQLASEKALEFDTIRLLLAHCTATPLGRALVEALEPISDVENIRAEQARLSAIRRCRDQGCSFDFSASSAVERSVPESRGKRPILEPIQLYHLASTLQEAAAYQQLLENIEGEEPVLAPLAEALEIDPSIAEQILSAVDQNGELLDEASAELLQLRKLTRSTREAINATLKRFFDQESHPDYVQEEFITIRGGRLVIPIKIEHRNRHRGIVHDRSRGGDSLFFEPIEVIELNNSLAELQAKTKLEEARILARLSALLFEDWSNVCRVLNTLAKLDLLSAKAYMAELYKGTEPTITLEGPLHIYDARHPLLDERLNTLRKEAEVYSSDADEQPVVPVTIHLGDEWNVLVITGPNAGGKTVALKTAGLLALMVQAGLQVPARDYTGPVFQTISADIGDYQNIFSHLSTFSSHLTLLKQLFLRMKTPALVLLDEISAATDPGEGSALAMAVLEQLQEEGAYVMATTHLEALKAFAQAKEGMENAAVEFNPDTMKPTYQLDYGLPGSSNALETAEEIGLPRVVIEKAHGYLGEGGARVSELISKLQEEITAIKRERDAVEEERQALESTRRHYVKKLDIADEKIAKELQQIRAEWQKFKRDQDEALRSSLSEIKKSQSLEKARATVRERGEALESEFESLKLPRRQVMQQPQDDGGPLAEGEVVDVPGFGEKGTVVRRWQATEDNDVIIEIQGKRFALPRVAVVRKKGAKPRRKSAKIKLVADERQPEMELNVIGLTVDEALQKTERFLDEALLKGLPWVRIIHGRGTGALRKAIAEHLKEQSFVSDWHPAEPSAGGDGITVVEFLS